ncbi:MAG: helix-turn-helix transcriptional regulator [Kiritimatiellae bacterium]|nr:helix-turn-helix transcriptional regulator [Kiritimatiellia bacterium]
MKTGAPPAYPETYLDDAMRTLGEAVDWAARVRGIAPARFLAAFSASGVADAFGAGVPKFVAGLSGAGLAREVLRRAGEPEAAGDVDGRCDIDGETPEFWTGWILAWYQWRTALPFRAILAFLPAEELHGMFATLHEASEERCGAAFDAIRRARRGATALARARKAAGLTQAQLSARSGVALRSIQQWEQRAKDIGRAAARSVVAIARVVGTTTDSLLAE